MSRRLATRPAGRRATGLALLALAGLLGGLLGGCTAVLQPAPAQQTGTSATAGAAATPAPAALPDGVSVRVYQNRFDYAARVLELSITNAGRTDVDLTTATFASPRFAAPAAWSERLLVEAGTTRDLRVHLATATCTGGGPTGMATAADTVTVTWAAASGSSQTATLVPLDDSGALDRIEGEDCLASAVDSVLTITPGTELRVDGAGAASVASLEVSLTPTGGPGTVSIDRVGATVLLASSTGLDWLVGLSLSAVSPPATITLGLRPTRCDPHAVAEDKRGTVLPLVVRTSGVSTGGEPAPDRSGTYRLVVGDALRAAIYAWIAEHCAY